MVGFQRQSVLLTSVISTKVTSLQQIFIHDDHHTHGTENHVKIQGQSAIRHEFCGRQNCSLPRAPITMHATPLTDRDLTSNIIGIHRSNSDILTYIALVFHFLAAGRRHGSHARCDRFSKSLRHFVTYWWCRCALRWRHVALSPGYQRASELARKIIALVNISAMHWQTNLMANISDTPCKHCQYFLQPLTE